MNAWGLLPDLATIRDRATHPWRRRLYHALSFGWNGSHRAWRHYESAYMVLAALATPLVFSVHTIVSFDFATSVMPGWHTTIFPPYFVIGAIFSGFAMVITLMTFMRGYFGMTHYITLNHMENMAKILMLTGMLVGMKELHPPLENCRVTYLDGDGKLGESFEAMRKFLRGSKAKRFLIGGVNDPSALGALRAMQEAGRVANCAAMGQNASPEGREELRQPGTRLIGSVAYFPEKYGEEIVAVALDILNRRPVPPAVFVKHQLVTPENVDHIYPNDRLMQTAATFA